MIKFIPYENEDVFGMRAFENDIELGYCTFSVNGFDMNFEEVDCNDDIITEGLARSAMNFAANRNAYIAKIKAEHVCPAFERLGFTKKSDLSVEIPEALTTGCTCSH